MSLAPSLMLSLLVAGLPAGAAASAQARAWLEAKDARASWRLALRLDPEFAEARAELARP